MILVLSIFMLRYGELGNLADLDHFLDRWYE